jgi:hypothetical protein
MEGLRSGEQLMKPYSKIDWGERVKRMRERRGEVVESTHDNQHKREANLTNKRHNDWAKAHGVKCTCGAAQHGDDANHSSVCAVFKGYHKRAERKTKPGTVGEAAGLPSENAKKLRRALTANGTVRAIGGTVYAGDTALMSTTDMHGAVRELDVNGIRVRRQDAGGRPTWAIEGQVGVAIPPVEEDYDMVQCPKCNGSGQRPNIGGKCQLCQGGGRISREVAISQGRLRHEDLPSIQPAGGPDDPWRQTTIPVPYTKFDFTGKRTPGEPDEPEAAEDEEEEKSKVNPRFKLKFEARLLAKHVLDPTRK